MNRKAAAAARSMLILLMLASLACSIPGFGSPSPTPAPTATETAEPPRPTATPRADLPPTLVQTDPLPGGEVPLQGPVVFAFNQPMDRASVEAAFQSASGLSGRFEWLDDSTLWFYPDEQLPPGTELDLSIGEGAQAANGRGLLMPISLNFRTVGYLRLTQALPEPGTSGINPAAAVVAAFNRPVVPLGAAQDELAPAFRLEPAAQGRGEWLNTSTYIFYPERALNSGQEYRVILEDDLTGVDGAPLDGQGVAATGTLPPNQAFTEWTFTTAQPQVLSVQPTTETPLGLDAGLSVQFNQPMDPDSVQQQFSFTGPQGQVAGQFSWDDSFSTLTFTPTAELARGANYTLGLAAAAQAAGGSALGSDLQRSFSTYPEFAIVGSLPGQGGVLSPRGTVRLTLSGPPESGDLSQFIEVQPRLPNLSAWYSEFEGLIINGQYEAATAYTIRVSPEFADQWGGQLGQPYVLEFTTSDYPADLQIPGSFAASNVIFLTPQDQSLPASALNVSSARLTYGGVPLQEFLRVMGSEDFDSLRNYSPSEITTQITTLELPRNRSEVVSLDFNDAGTALSPGIYHLRVQSQADFPVGPYMMVVSDIPLTFKLSATEALVWATRMTPEGISPVAGAPVTIYDQNGQPVTNGTTDQQGVFRSQVPPAEELYRSWYAVLGEPGSADFSLALSSWDHGFEAYNFNLPTDYRPPHLEAYVYTDRPIYRPGQTVNFRGVVRQAYDGRYELPEIDQVAVRVAGMEPQPLLETTLPLSEYGTVNGEVLLPVDSQPGFYVIEFGQEPSFGSIGFQVADYRTPEIELQLAFQPEKVLNGSTLQAEVTASYYFGPPAADVSLDWTLYRQRAHFDLPGYQVGPRRRNLLDPFLFFGEGGFGSIVDSGSGTTDAQGQFALSLDPAFREDDPPERGSSWRYTLEVTVRDESGLPVSGRSAVVVHPEQFYVGLQPASWTARAGQPAQFEVKTVDWEGRPSPGRALTARYLQVNYRASGELDDFGLPVYIEETTLIDEQTLQTDAQGEASLSFTPPEAGTYLVTVSGGEALTEIYQWVSGGGQADWPEKPNNQLDLVADQEGYVPGETASVLIPNTLGQPAQALVTVERGTVMDYEVLSVPAEGLNYELSLTAQDAPNIYLSALLLIPGDFRYGLLQLPVAPEEQTLQVSLAGEPQVTGPGGQVTLDLQVQDSTGSPVQGEFSLAVVDKAVLALADPNAPPIEDAFYRRQPLGVRTGIALTAYAGRQVFDVGGLGGGGGAMEAALSLPEVREDFRDTAYWNGMLETDAGGRAQVEVQLPENLTTWQIDARGVDLSTRVGQAQAEVLTTKDLLVRPVTPRFLVIDDHLQLAAVVQNNTDRELQVTAGLQSQGFLLDASEQASQELTLPPGGRERVTWWGTVQDVSEVDLVFSAEAGDLQDAARPARGPLPVLSYSTPQTFGTAGTLDQGGERLEVVSLPTSFDPQGGELRLELSPSLGAVLLQGLQALDVSPYLSSEQVISRFLPNLEAYRALQSFGLNRPELEDRLEQLLDDSLSRLLSTQNTDGGWNWWPEQGTSDPYVTAYVVFGLSRMQQSGGNVPAGALTRAADYLAGQLVDPGLDSESWQLDRTAFSVFALSQIGEGERTQVRTTALELFDQRERLSPWSAALLALNFEADSDAARTLLSDLQADAIRSATGAHWEAVEPAPQNFGTPVFVTSAVIYALAQRDPAAAILPEAVRYVVAHREANNGWVSSYDSAWSLMGLAEVMKGTGELAGDFEFAAAVNDITVAEGSASGDAQLNPVTAAVPVSDLYFRSPNALVIERGPGTGRLYYNAHLQVLRPVPEVESSSQGLSVQREYYPLEADCQPQECLPVDQGSATGLVEARLTVTLPEDAYYLVVEDYLPAGAEVLDDRLNTSQQGQPPGMEPEPQPLFDPRDPFRQGFGWWQFNDPRVYDDRIAWTVDYLPAGTYQLNYVLVLNQPGEYRVLPPLAYQLYFPEVRGNGRGQIFTIRE